jgi:hypothetical protein
VTARYGALGLGLCLDLLEEVQLADLIEDFLERRLARILVNKA